MKKDLLKILNREKWKTYKFGEIAKSINEQINPTKTELDIYVGLEHLDSETVHINRFGKRNDVTGTKLRCYPGDIIFGRRRAYQRKASIVNFDGFCSAHSLVLRANQNIIYPQLFPFFLHSDLFMHRAVDISVGSLSPTINWGTLKEQEFLLPPKEEQAQLAKLLWAADNVVEKDKALLERLEVVKFRTLKYIFSEGNGSKSLKHFANYKIPANWEIKKMEEISNIEYGISESVANNSDPAIGWPILTGANITLKGEIDNSKLVYIKEPNNEKFFLKKGDLLFNWRSGSPEHIGKTAMFNLDGNYTHASFVLKIRCNKNVINHFLYTLLNYLREIEYFTRDVAQQVNFKINASIFRQVQIPIPEISIQMEITQKIKDINRTIEDSKSKLQSSQALLKSLINEVFQ